MENIQSEQINEIVSALAKAQAEINPAAKEGTNPHFKSKYASYDSIRGACQDVLPKYGLAITHHLIIQDQKRVMMTQLSHVSGQWMRSFLMLPQEKETPQGVGSSITYAKRYTISSLLAMPTKEDDDGEEAERAYRLSPDQLFKIRELAEPARINNICKTYSAHRLEDVEAKHYETIMAVLSKGGKS